MSTMLWSCHEVHQALKKDAILRSFSTEFWVASGVSCDTRTLKPGQIYWALRGKQFDGHRFVEEALSKGAVAVVVDQKFNHARAIYVYDTLQALWTLAHAARQRAKAHIIGITGSVGKTTLKAMLQHVLLNLNISHYAAPGNFNNHIGLPLSLIHMPPQAKFGIFELGMSAEGEIAQLSRLLLPHLAVITDIAPAHYESFQSLHDIARAKMEIVLGVVEHGTLVMDAASESCHQLLTHMTADGSVRLHTRLFSMHSNIERHLTLQKITITSQGVQVMIKYGHGSMYSFNLSCLGADVIRNAVIALTVLSQYFSLRLVMPTLQNFMPPEGRGKVHWNVKARQGYFCLIDQSYNANPSSMKMAIETLGAHATHQRIAILGDMKSLGKEREVQFHQELVEHLTRCNIHHVVVYGPLMRQMGQHLPHAIHVDYAGTVEEIIEILYCCITNGAVVMIKGSNAMNLHQVIRHFVS